MRLCESWALYLYSSFGQVDPGSQLGPDMDVRVVGKVEELLQFLELLRGEGSANSPLAPFFFCGKSMQVGSMTWLSVTWGAFPVALFFSKPMATAEFWSLATWNWSLAILSSRTPSRLILFSPLKSNEPSRKFSDSVPFFCLNVLKAHSFVYNGR